MQPVSPGAHGARAGAGPAAPAPSRLVLLAERAASWPARSGRDSPARCPLPPWRPALRARPGVVHTVGPLKKERFSLGRGSGFLHCFTVSLRYSFGFLRRNRFPGRWICRSPRFAGDVSPLCSTSASARSGPAAPPRARGLRLGPCTASRGHGAGDLALDDPLWGSSWRQCRPARTGHAASPATPGAAPRGHSPGDAAQLAHMLAVRSPAVEIIVCGLEGALFPPTAFPLVSDILEARHRQMRSPSAAAAENAGVIARGLRKKQKRHLRQLPKRGQ
ncbi:unnamed protein product [Prorocentrum cordatum]|uniref:Uncharacterized protein n=1 Tax=Prorocentrum cordatum TaxID=2364126 RepID=A0ABN9XPY0_9DINO|nr:unnamed protein product [Polarella glacialis]